MKYLSLVNANELVQRGYKQKSEVLRKKSDAEVIASIAEWIEEQNETTVAAAIVVSPVDDADAGTVPDSDAEAAPLQV